MIIILVGADNLLFVHTVNVFNCQITLNRLLYIKVWRHGDRTPFYTYPTDAYNENYWSTNGFQGLGELTPVMR